MIVLGIQFGHDASIAVLKDGVPVFLYEKERYSRVKYAIGLDAADFRYVFERCGIDAADIDYCGVTASQTLEYFFFDPEAFSFEVGSNGIDALESGYDREAAAYIRYQPFGEIALAVERKRSGRPPGMMWDFFRQYWDRDLSSVPGHLPFEQFIWLDRWGEVKTLQAMGQTDYSEMLTDAMRKSFHVPIRVTLFGRVVPGIMLSHHYAHAAYSFFESDLPEAGILTHDGGYDETSYLGGMFYYGRGASIFPLTPHFLNIGPLYDTVASFLKLGFSGKVMGLSGWGKPAFFKPDLVGNIHDEPGSKDRHLAGC